MGGDAHMVDSTNIYTAAKVNGDENTDVLRPQLAPRHATHRVRSGWGPARARTARTTRRPQVTRAGSNSPSGVDEALVRAGSRSGRTRREGFVALWELL